MDAEALSPEWQLWIVENLLLGAEPSVIAQALVADGIAESLAIYHIKLTLESATFARMRDRAKRATLTERAFALCSAPVETTVPRVSSVSEIDFYQYYFKSMSPVVVTEQFKAIATDARWGFDSLSAQYGAHQVQLTTNRTAASSPSVIESQSERTTFAAVIEHAVHGSGNDRYLVARNGLLHQREFAALLAALGPLPSFMAPIVPQAPAVSLWIGPRDTHTPTHFDPHSAMLIQVRGRKVLRLVPPTQTALYELSEGYFLRCDLEDPAVIEHPDFDPRSVLTVELAEGEALFLPALWWHDVRALTPSITLSCLNFVWPNNFHSIFDKDDETCGHHLG
jgi:hypothetical protein